MGMVVIATYVVHKFGEEEKPEPKPETVKCEECKCLLEKSDAHKVANFGHLITYNDDYYCVSHKKPYTKTLYNRYFSSMEVTEQGEPIGYIKATEKKRGVSKSNIRN